jgi:hydrogenase maturation protease
MKLKTETSSRDAAARTLVVGLGNPILGYDGVGWRIAERLTALLPDATLNTAAVDIECLAVGGLSLMEHLIGYDQVILVDAITTGKAPQGDVYVFPLEDLPNRAIGHFSSAHDTTIQNALQVGRSMGAHLPQKITIVAVEAVNIYEFSEELTPPIAAAVSVAVQKVLELLQD